MNYGVKHEGDCDWHFVWADDLHGAAEFFAQQLFNEDPAICEGGSVRVDVRRPDGDVFPFVVQVEYDPSFTAKMIHKRTGEPA